MVAGADRDLAKFAVIQRHHATGRLGIGLVRGFGLRTRASACTVAHDARNLVVVGVSDEDLAVRAELALPVAGLLSDEPLEDVVARPEELQEILTE